MNSPEQRALHRLAESYGVQTSYVDNAGNKQFATREVLVATLKVLGVCAENKKEVRDCLREVAEQTRVVEPVIVVLDQRPAKVALRLLKTTSTKQLKLRIRFEDGRTRELDARKLSGRSITLPGLPFGYHQLELADGDQLHRSLIISAPRQSFSEFRSEKSWGLFLPMYAAHSEQSWGAGNFSDWQKLSQWVGSLGGSITGSLPLLAAFLDFPASEPSPYSPASRLFWNEFYIDVTRAPEFGNCKLAQKLVASADFQKQLRAFRESELIDYQTQWIARRKVLELLAESFFAKPSPRRAEFERFIRERPQAEEYAAFRAACDKLKTSWHNWPQRLFNGELQRGDYDEATKCFHLYTQWLAQQQVDELIRASEQRGVQLYLDLPLGVHPDGYDVWRERESFALGANAGAPPDMFFTKGQDWGFSPLHPQRLRESGYRYLLAFLRFQMRHTGWLRIDHVMGLHRLYWIPRGCSPAQGVYVRYPAEEWHAIFNLESHRHHTRLVCENLGTVPPEVNRALKRHRLREMFVVQYELKPDAKAALRAPPPLSVASLNTHDMPTFAAFWQGDDLAVRNELGLIPTIKMPDERQNRNRLKATLTQFLTSRGLLTERTPKTKDVLRALLAWLGAGDAEMLLINAEDLWQETEPQNVPGTSTELPNWRRKARFALETIEQNREFVELLRVVAEPRKPAGK